MHPKLIRRDLEITENLPELMAEASYCTVALNSPLDYPYVVAVNHVMFQGKLYFHCAQKGFKLDCLAHDNRVCLKAILQADIVPEEYTTDYKSIVAFGKGQLVEDPALKAVILEKLMARFSPGIPLTKACSEEGIAKTAIVEITLEHITGKTNLPPVK